MVELRSNQFRRERAAAWSELEQLVRLVERDGPKALSPDQLARLPVLYRAGLSSLAVARAISLDRGLLDYLENLCARAYLCVYAPRQSPGEAAADFALCRFPRAVRQSGRAIALSAAFFLLGVIAGFAMTASDPSWFYSFVSPEYAGGRTPAASTHDLEAALYDRGGAADTLSAFAAFLFSHNGQIALLAVGLGVLAGLPVFPLLFANGLTVGAFGALYHGRGLGLEFWGWVLPHGVTELSAVVLCGGAGLVLAHALVFPGRLRRLDNLKRAGRTAGTIALGGVIMLLAAALIEGLFRQLVHSTPIRYAVAAVTAAFWIAFFERAGRADAPEEEAAP